MPYRLLALDLDGTVVPHSLDVSPAVRSAIQAAQQRGVTVTLATGRMFAATLPFAELLGVHGPLICYQGGMVRHATTGETYAHELMPADAVTEAVQELMRRDIFVIAYVEERLCIAERRPELDTYMAFHPEGAPLEIMPDLAERVRDLPVTKLLFCADPLVVDVVLPALREQFRGQLSAVRSHAIFGELTPPGITKGAALAQLAARLGVPRSDVMAIGDQENDIPMLEWAGLGLAMGNGIPEAKAAANVVIPGIDDDGVAWAIEHYILRDEQP